jgi:hypothetical protein
MAVLLEVRKWTAWRVDWDVREVRTAESLDLRVEVRKVAPLKEGIIGEVDSRRHILCHKRDLLGLSEEVIDHAIEHEPTDDTDGEYFLRDQLGWV